MFLVLVSSLIPLLSEDIVYDFCSFQLVKVCFMAQKKSYLSECSMWIWEGCIFYAPFGWSSLYMSIISSWLMLLSLTIPLTDVLLPAGSIFDRGVLNSSSIVVDSSTTAVLSVLPHVFWCSVLRSIHVSTVCCLGELTPFLWSLLSEINVATWLVLAYYLSPSLSFNVYVTLLKFKVDFCRQYIIGSWFLIHTGSWF